MIHTATQTAKFKKLARRIRPLLAGSPVSAETVAVGILESLWHTTIGSAVRGDIGRIDNETICEMIGWHGDPDALISSLMETGWIESHPEHRLIIHDWSEHAPAFVKRNIARKGGFVCAGKRALNDSDEQGSARLTTQKHQEAATPNLTKPNVTKPNQTEPNFSVRNQQAGSVRCRFSFTLKSSKLWDLDESKIDEWVETYGDREWVESQLKKARQWCIDNPEKRKTPRGMLKFLSNWLMRNNDRNGTPRSEPPVSRVATPEQLANYNPNGVYE